MAITERQKNILFEIFRSYIKGGEPVGSKTIASAQSFGIGPAMIRQEMAMLEREGYIEQPHISAGRIPTDKAYKLYISELDLRTSERDLSKKEQRDLSESIKDNENDTRKLLEDLSRVVSTLSGDLSVSGIPETKVHFAYGFSSLAHEPEFSHRREMQQLFGFIDEMDRYFEEIWRRSHRSSFDILVGEETPLTGLKSLSIITGTYRLPEGSAGFVSIIGPRRMNYRKNAAVIRYIQSAINEL